MSKIFVLFFYLHLLVIKADVTRRDDKNVFIIDNDAGADDAIAIFMTLLFEKYFNGPELIALTTVNGNTEEKNVYINNQKILKKANRQDIPIYRGANSSLVYTPTTTAYYGSDGLGDNGEPWSDLIPIKERTAVEALIELSKRHAGKLTVISIGPLTNIALAIKVDPGFLERLDHLYVGAGHIQSKEHKDAEFNAHMDVEAYHIVAQYAQADKVTVLPFSQVYAFVNIDKDWRINTFGTIDTEIIRAINVYERVSIDKEEKWAMLDPLVVATALYNDPYRRSTVSNFITEYKYSKNGIILWDENRGLNTNIFTGKDEANVRVAYEFNMEKYKTFLMNVFTAELRMSK